MTTIAVTKEAFLEDPSVLWEAIKRLAHDNVLTDISIIICPDGFPVVGDTGEHCEFHVVAP